MSASDRPRARSATAPEVVDPLRPARIVVADNDRLSRDVLAGILRSAGHTVEIVDDGAQAVELVSNGNVDLVLVDVMMPCLSGLDACRVLKGTTLDGFLPVVLMNSKGDPQSRAEGLRMGADDYLCKPIEEDEIVGRVATMLRIKRLHDQVAQQKATFERLSMHDEMTGLYNYRYLNTRLNEEFKRAERYHEPFACLLVDIDQLRALNDLGGRASGDQAILRVAEGIKQCVREVDVVARYGGEEFVVVLPSTHFAGSVAVAERIWQEVSGRPIEVDVPKPERRSEPPASSRRRGGEPARPPVSRPEPGNDPKWAEGPRALTVSIGVGLFPSRDVRTKEALLRAAEAALAEAKREGGNRICVFQQQGYMYTPAVSPSRPAGDEPPSSRASGPQVRRWRADSTRPGPDTQDGGRKSS